MWIHWYIKHNKRNFYGYSSPCVYICPCVVYVAIHCKNGSVHTALIGVICIWHCGRLITLSVEWLALHQYFYSVQCAVIPNPCAKINYSYISKTRYLNPLILHSSFYIYNYTIVGSHCLHEVNCFNYTITCCHCLQKLYAQLHHCLSHCFVFSCNNSCMPLQSIWFVLLHEFNAVVYIVKVDHVCSYDVTYVYLYVHSYVPTCCWLSRQPSF